MMGFFSIKPDPIPLYQLLAKKKAELAELIAVFKPLATIPTDYIDRRIELAGEIAALEQVALEHEELESIATKNPAQGGAD